MWRRGVARHRALTTTLVLALGSLAAAPGPAAEPGAPRRVLFIGNSLTYAHDFPGMVAAISRREDGTPALEVDSVTWPNAALEDHWARKEALRAIERGGWSHVVLQQGPSSLPANEALLVAWTRRFAKRIRAAGARPALYMVWPAAARSEDFPRVESAYAAAARAVDGLLIPAGSAWRAAWRRERSLELYGPDGFHPSPLGTFLAALVAEAALTGRPPRAAPVEIALGGGTLVVPPERARLLAEAAAEALAAR